MPDSQQETGFVKGYSAAMKEFETKENPEYINPFPGGTEEHRGYEEGVYDLTCK